MCVPGTLAHDLLQTRLTPRLASVVTDRRLDPPVARLRRALFFPARGCRHVPFSLGDPGRLARQCAVRFALRRAAGRS